MAGPLKFEIEIVDRPGQANSRTGQQPTPQQPASTSAPQPQNAQQPTPAPRRTDAPASGDDELDIAEQVRRRGEELAGLRSEVSQAEQKAADEGTSEEDRRAANDQLGELLARVLQLQDEHRADLDALGMRAEDFAGGRPETESPEPAQPERQDEDEKKEPAPGDDARLDAAVDRVRREAEETVAQLRRALEGLLRPTDEVRELFERLAREETPGEVVRDQLAAEADEMPGEVARKQAEETPGEVVREQLEAEASKLPDEEARRQAEKATPQPVELIDMSLPPDEPPERKPPEKGGGVGSGGAMNWAKEVRRKFEDVELDTPAEGREEEKPEDWPEDLPHPSEGQGKKEKNPFDQGKPGMDGLDRLLYQTGFGKLGNFFAMMDKMQESSAKGEKGIAGILPVLGVAQAAGSVAAGAMDTATGGIRAAGGVGVGIARNDMRAMEQVVDGVTSTLRKIPIVGEALGSQLDLMIAPAKALRDVFEALASRGKELAGYSAPISQAQAMAEVNTILADIKEADTMGEDYATLIRLENEFQMAWREAILPIKKMMAQFVGEEAGELKKLIADVGVGVAEVVKLLLPFAKQAISVTSTAANFFGGVMTGLTGIRRATENTARNTERSAEPDPNQLMVNLYNVLGSANPNTGQDPPNINSVANGLPVEIPIVRGR